MSLNQIPQVLRDYYEIDEWRHAVAILAADFPAEWADITSVLSTFRLFRSEINTPGGSKSRVAMRIDSALANLGWLEQELGSSYGASTTHMSKLRPRLEGGSGGGCPILVFGITTRLYVED